MSQPQTAFSLVRPSGPTTINKKGDPLIVAQLAGIMAAKRTADLIPLCHNIALSGVDVAFELEAAPSGQGDGWVRVEAQAECVGGTGVEVRFDLPSLLDAPLIEHRTRSFCSRWRH